MDEKEQSLIETMVVFATRLSSDERAKFVFCLHPSLFEDVVRRLKESFPDERFEQKPVEDNLAATLDLESDPVTSQTKLETDRTVSIEPNSGQVDSSFGLDRTVVEVPVPQSEELVSEQELVSQQKTSSDQADTLYIESQVDLADVSGDSQKLSADDAASGSGNRIKVIRPHARGAVGEVYVAYDTGLRREVALKRIRAKHLGKTNLQSRFVREAVITGQLQHPGIVPIYSFESTDGSANYTMPLISGETLAQAIKKLYVRLGANPTYSAWLLEIRPLLNCFIAVCRAIDYAHSRGVIHRDLKPANIILGEHGQTLVLDWGCARPIGRHDSYIDSDFLDEVTDPEDSGVQLPENPSATVVGTVLGTIQYMSPEQASGANEELTLSSDIFGLGATLFNLLTNETVVGERTDMMESLHLLRSGVLPNPAVVNSRVPASLAAICAKAIQRRPSDRYESAGDLANDIDRFLAGQPVLAYREPLLVATRRRIKQHQTVFATVLGMLLIGFVSLIGVTYILNDQRTLLAEKNKDLEALNIRIFVANQNEHELNEIANRGNNLAQRNLYSSEMLLASEASQDATGIGRVRELVDHWRDDGSADVRGWEWNQLDQYAHQEYRVVDIAAMADAIYLPTQSTLSNGAFAKILSIPQSLMLTVEYESGRLIKREQLPIGVTAADYSPDRRELALGFQDGRIMVESDGDKEAMVLPPMKSPVTELSWNPRGTFLAVSNQRGELIVWNNLTKSIQCTGSDVLNQGGRRHFSWTKDGLKLAWTTGQELRLVDIESGESKVLVTDDWISHPTLSHDGQMLAYVGADNAIRVMDSVSGDAWSFIGHQLFIEALTWHPTRNYLLSASADGSMRIWNADSRKEVRLLRGHVGHVYSAAWSPHGNRIVSGGYAEDSLRVWDMTELSNPAFERELASHPAISWHPDGDWMAVAEGSEITLQNLAGNMRILPADAEMKPTIFGLKYSHGGDQLACISGTGRVWIVQTTDGATVRVFDEGRDSDLYPSPGANGVQWSPHDQFVAAVDHDGGIGVWDVSSGERIASPPIDGTAVVVAWSPSGRQLAYAGADNDFHIWNAETNETISITQYGWKTALAWSPDGLQLGVSDRRSINIWDVDKKELIQQCKGPSSMLVDMQWKGDVNRLAAITEDGAVCCWDTRQWSYCAKYNLHRRPPYAISWSPDSATLASTSRHGRIEFLRVLTPQK